MKQGHFVTENRGLKLCTIQPGGMKGRIENRGRSMRNDEESIDFQDVSMEVEMMTLKKHRFILQSIRYGGKEISI